MSGSAVFFLCLFLAYRSLAETQNSDGSVCLLTDPPKQCGEFCLTALKPLIDHIAMHQEQWKNSDILKINETRVKLDRILERQETWSLKTIIPPGFEKIGNRYFYVEKNHHQNWFSASKTCLQMGGQLAVIQDEAELTDLRARITHDTSYWLDINDLVNEGDYVS
ncbi:accessory gland protein Acp29AB-like [Drosophila eugracilis]|uniref:accessory gland protein Acp29AB-like n=1 Tax=Drosophila eugracilis TaxID=29029 RepID=UPI001BDAED8B|nr:accessory gland protein Acp29AB-like [Drosophila eugracilis]